jgi:nucleoside-diphosphate-sugar epimerase
MSVERILVTGASGFVGSHLCERLTREGYLVRALVHNTNISAALHRCEVEVVVGDILDSKSIEQAMEGIDVVYHIAALFRRENVSRKKMWETNVLGTKHMLDAAVKAGVQRFVHCSTVGVLGDIENPPANEKSPYRPDDYYQETKAESERVVLQYIAEGRLPIVIFRPGGIYGPRDLRFLKLFKAIKNKRFVMLGSGEVIYQMIYIDNLIDGILLCGTKEKIIGNVYILTGNEQLTLNQIVQVIAEALDVSPPILRFPVTPVYLASYVCELLCKPLGINPPLYRRRVNFFRKMRCFDISKAKLELGFQPKVDFKEGIRRTSEWYKKERLL